MTIDLTTLKIGSVVKMTGTIIELCTVGNETRTGETGYRVRWNGSWSSDASYMTAKEMKEAELVSNPEVKFTKEQVDVLKDLEGKIYSGWDGWSEWLDEHTEK